MARHVTIGLAWEDWGQHGDPTCLSLFRCEPRSVKKTHNFFRGRQAHKRLMEGGVGKRAHHGVEATGPAGIKTWHGSLPSSLPSLPSLHPPQVHIIADTGVELTPGQ